MVTYNIDKIEAALRERGLSNGDLAILIKMSAATVSHVMNSRHASRATVKKIAEALGLKMKDIIVVVEDEKATA